MSELIVLFVPLLGTSLGAAMVFLMRREMNRFWKRLCWDLQREL